MTRGPFHQHGLTLIPAWLSNHMLSKICDEVTYSFPNFNSCTVEVWEWISNFTPHFMMDVITYPCCQWILLTKDLWCRALMFSLLTVWTTYLKSLFWDIITLMWHCCNALNLKSWWFIPETKLVTWPCYMMHKRWLIWHYIMLLGNTLRLRQKGRHFTDIFKCIFLNDDFWIVNKISVKYIS